MGHRLAVLLMLGSVISGCGDSTDESSAATDAGDTLTGDVMGSPVDPGRVVWRRLNRTEYDNTVRDLLGTAQRPGLDFPADDTSFGFDNIASVLTLSPLHLELYERAADSLMAEALTEPVEEPIDYYIPAEDITFGPGNLGGPINAGFALWSNGVASFEVDVPLDGIYEFSVLLWAKQAGPELAMMAVNVGGVEVFSSEIAAESLGQAELIVVPVTLVAGRNQLGVAFLNDYYNPDLEEDLNLFFAEPRLTGPEERPLVEDAVWWSVIDCQPGSKPAAECARLNIERFAGRAWRRPLSEAQVDRLMALWQEAVADGLTEIEALQLPIKAILMAPQFIFKTEFQTDAGDPAAEPLDGWAIATRLSYLIWSSMPDEALFAAAADGRLDTADGIEAEVRRMLDDPKAQALVDNFGGQWLFIRGIDNSFPDLGRFPAWNEDLRGSMREEMRRFFESFVFGERSLVELFTSDEAVIDARLAEHYGLDVEIPEGQFQTVSIAGTPRRGLLGQAGLMTTLSTPFRTSIVRRGKWVLSQLLCAEPDPPPAGVEARIDEELPGPPKTLRQRMEAHVTEPACKGCHESMDPIGFALEHYDATGAWRELDNGVPIDATGQLPDGQTFDGPLELSAVLGADERMAGCITEQLMTYALGRGLLRADTEVVERIAGQLETRGFTFEELLVLVATSEPFRQRNGEFTPGGP